MSPLLPLLSQFLKLKELYGNRLKQLPSDLSSLKNLETLNVTNNLISNLDACMKSLQTIQNLRYLSLTLKDKEDENNVIKLLPNLRSINNRGNIYFFYQIELNNFGQDDSF